MAAAPSLRLVGRGGSRDRRTTGCSGRDAYTGTQNGIPFTEPLGYKLQVCSHGMLSVLSIAHRVAWARRWELEARERRDEDCLYSKPVSTILAQHPHDRREVLEPNKHDVEEPVAARAVRQVATTEGYARRRTQNWMSIKQQENARGSGDGSCW